MVFIRCVALLAVMLSSGHLVDARQGDNAAANPIRRVVSMLQMMEKKVTKEGEKEKELFERFMCYCKTGVSSLEKAIDDAETKIPQLQSDIDGMGEENVRLASEVDQHKKDREAAKASMAEATALREKQTAIFAALHAETSANVEAMTKALAALEAGSAGGFLQTPAAGVLRKIVSVMNLDESDRDVVTSFLSQGQGYAPQSGQIIGILKNMVDTMDGDLADATAVEEKAKADYAGLMGAKNKEVEALTQMIEEKLERLGSVGVQIVNLKEDLADTQESLESDKKFLKELQKGCSTKEAEWDERSRTRAEELVALADTIKLLNDDDALELFKKTLPSPSLLQTQVSAKEVALQAQDALQRGAKKDYRLDLIALALKGRKVNFDKVITMIDDMVALLKREQKDDDDKKLWCEAEFDSSDDKKKALERSISDLETTIDDNKETLAATTDAIAALTQGIKALDKQVAEASAQRKEENADYTEESAANHAALEILGIAKNRLNKFYNPKMYKAPAKRELSEEERITVNMGGTLAPTAAPGGIAGTGVTALVQDRPEPPPETWGAYKKSGEESTGVIAMIDNLAADLSKEMQESEAEEKDAQKDYEQMMEDSTAKRADDSKTLAAKEGVKADLEVALQTNAADLKATQHQAMANAEYIHNLHLDCDWLTSNFDFRKEAREGEVDSLKKAKAVLSGADFSLVQTKRNLRVIQRA